MPSDPPSLEHASAEAVPEQLGEWRTTPLPATVRDIGQHEAEERPEDAAPPRPVRMEPPPVTTERIVPPLSTAASFPTDQLELKPTITLLRPTTPVPTPWQAETVPKRLDFVLEPHELGPVRMTLVLAGTRPRLTVSTATEAAFAALRADGELLLPILREIRGGEGSVQIVLQAEPQAGPSSSQGETWGDARQGDPRPGERRGAPTRHNGRRPGGEGQAPVARDDCI